MKITGDSVIYKTKLKLPMGNAFFLEISASLLLRVPL